MATYLFEKIVLPEPLSQYQIEGPDERTLAPLGKINIFVGVNNSGKSRLMREFASTSLIGMPQHAGLSVAVTC